MVTFVAFNQTVAINWCKLLLQTSCVRRLWCSIQIQFERSHVFDNLPWFAFLNLSSRVAFIPCRWEKKPKRTSLAVGMDWDKSFMDLFFCLVCFSLFAQNPSVHVEWGWAEWMCKNLRGNFWKLPGGTDLPMSQLTLVERKTRKKETFVLQKTTQIVFVR